MAVLDASDHLAPKSILRHRPTGMAPAQAIGTPLVPRASRQRQIPLPPAQPDDDEAITAQIPPPMPSRNTHVLITATKKVSARTTSIPARVPQMRQARRLHWLLSLGVGMLAMLALWTVLSSAMTWVQTTLDDWRYGRPRTFQVDAFVQHGEQSGIPSHFIALNLNRHIQIVELPGGDPEHARIYSGPILYGQSDELVPVTLSFADVNSDGKPDMILHVQDARIVFINDGASFRPMRPDELPLVKRYLQRHPHT